MTDAAEAGPRRAAGGAAGFTVEIDTAFEPALPLWSRLADVGAALPFQRPAWLAAWSATIGRRAGLVPVAATIFDEGGSPVMALPLVRFRQNAVRRLEFADSGLADYNAPILGPGAPKDAAGAARAWRALRGALREADLLCLAKMPTRVGGRVNPFALLPGARPSPMSGLVLDLAGSVADWRAGLPRRYRMELGRCGRLFDALPGARFERVAGDGGTVCRALEDLQRERIDTLGLPYILDQDDVRDFYRTLAADLHAGPGILTALRTDDGVVAALFGLRQGESFVMLRIGADAAQSRLSPARHLIVATMERLAAEGVTRFDFGLGDYPYKRKLGGVPVDLVDVVAATSPLGVPELAAIRIKARVRAMPRLHAALSRARRKAAPTDPGRAPSAFADERQSKDR